MKYRCTANSNFAYFIKLTTALECQKQLLMSSISNLGGRESLETAVTYIALFDELSIGILKFLLIDCKIAVRHC